MAGVNRFDTASVKRAPAPTAGSAAEKPRKYTLLLTPEEAAAVEGSRSRLGLVTRKKVSQAALTHVLYDLLRTDDDLFARVADILRNGDTA